jgi:hypothetical protein
MERDYLGYLLKALDLHEQREMEGYLRTHPEAQARLESLQHTLDPLSWDTPETPPADLVSRTMALAMPMQLAGSVAANTVLRGFKPGRRLVEMVVAAGILLVAAGLIAAWIGRLRTQQPGGEPNPVQMVECHNNLQKLYAALHAYSDSHGRQFPSVANTFPDKPERNIAGLVYPMLYDAKVLSYDVSVRCPGAIGLGVSPYGLDDIKKMKEPQFECWANHLHHSYSYSLGYKGKRPDDEKASAFLPLMADSAPPDPKIGNSPHHGGLGQNVLYSDGHITFCTGRNVGYNKDDIYLNRAGKVAAGLDWTDTVLSSSLATPH